MKRYTVLNKNFTSKIKNAFQLSESMEKGMARIFPILFLGLISVTALYGQRPVVTYDVSATYPNTNLIIPADNSKDYILKGTTSINTVTISSGYKGTITLQNLKITSSKAGQNGNNTARGSSTDASCITVLGEYDGDNLDPITRVNIILDGNNELIYTNNYYCAFQVNQGAQIHINAKDPNDKESGKLKAENQRTANGSGGGGAGIGAPNFYSNGNKDNIGQGRATIIYKGTTPHRTNTAGGNVIIGSGTVIAIGGHGAGIGGGWYTWYRGVIIVYGGDVTSTAKYHSAGIGTGCPQGNGIEVGYYAENSIIMALPPAGIKATGAPNDSKNRLAGAQNTTYMNDPNTSTITIHTEDYEKNIDIYIDLSAAMASDNMKLEDLFGDLEVPYDLKKVRIGRTDPNTGIFTFNAEFKDPTTFFTDASSTHPDYLGRPYMPEVVNSITGSKTNKVDIELKRLDMEISFTDYPSTPLEVGYTAIQARQNAHMIKMEYNDDQQMSALTFNLQGGGVHFENMIFLDSNKQPLTLPPTVLNKGDVYYIVLPIVVGKPLGIYSDVLLIGGAWNGKALPGYIRRIGQQRVVKNDTEDNKYIKVTANPVEFVDEKNPAVKTVNLTLNIDHKETGIVYDQLSVKARYLITTEPDYDLALLANPDINKWAILQAPANNGQNSVTTVSFKDMPRGVYYIHWYVESGVVYAHSQNVTKPQHTYGGFGPYVLTSPVVAGKITGNPAVCQGDIPSEIRGELSTGGSGDFSYQWQMSTNGSSWTNVGTDSHNYTPAPLTVSPTYFRRLTTDKIYGGTPAISNVFAIYIVSQGQAFYWKRTAGNSNWNDPSNWVNEQGAALNMVPVSCSNVFIPGGASNYPSLHIDKTPIDLYGEPVCNNITFAYGAELVYQHKLTYQKAFVQYNWGYYNTMSGITPGTQPTGNDCSPGPAKKRDKWYALAAPLKSMATGDFAFAGYPLTWQAGFSMSHPQTGVAGGEIEVGDFTKKFSTNDKPLSETNNAIAVKVATYQNSIGYADHKYLQSLKGIIEIPYFENSTKAPFYPGHNYDRFTKESKFYYFNPETLQILHSPVGKMKRCAEAYRFIYEENGAAPIIDVAGVPSKVPGYKLKVKRQNSSSLKVMVGNPFLSAINAKQLLDVNGNKILESDGYYLFNSDTQEWKHQIFANGGNIPPMQAFIITLKNEEVDLLFPLEGTYALAGYSLSINPGGKGRSLYLKSQGSDKMEGDYSILMADTDKGVSNVRKMISTQDNTTPETFFISPDNSNYNVIQAYENGMKEIAIGVKCSDTKNAQSLIFENVEAFFANHNIRPVLLDKSTGAKQDLVSNNTYSFTQRPTDAKNNYIDADRFVLKLVTDNEPAGMEKDITIVYQNNQVEVKATSNIKEIQIYDMLGRKIYSEENINTNVYTKTLAPTQGIYIVKAYTDNGKVKVEKIMAY